jgi:hypothetical protein
LRLLFFFNFAPLREKAFSRKGAKKDGSRKGLSLFLAGRF